MHTYGLIYLKIHFFIDKLVFNLKKYTVACQCIC